MLRLLLEICIITLAIAGLIALGLYTGQRIAGNNGDAAAAMHLSDSLGRSVVLLLAQIISCLIIGSAIGRLLSSQGAGFLVMSVGMLAFVSQSGSAQDWMRQRQGDTIQWLTIETCTYAILAYAMAWSLAKSVGHWQIDPQQPTGPTTSTVAKFVSGFGRVTLGVIIALPIIWLIARSSLAGQTIAATTIAAIVATLFTYLLTTTSSAKSITSNGLLYVITPLAGVVGYASFAMFDSQTPHPFPDSPMSWLTPLMLPMPMHYLTGTLLGTTIGIAWAKSFEHNEEEGRIQKSRIAE